MAMVPAVSGNKVVSAVTTTAPVVSPEPSSTLVVLVTAETSAPAVSTVVVALAVVSTSDR